MEFLCVITPNSFSSLMSWVWLYIGPDVFLPIASAFAAVAGFLLMFWQKVVSFVGRIFGRGRSEPPGNSSKP